MDLHYMPIAFQGFAISFQEFDAWQRWHGYGWRFSPLSTLGFCWFGYGFRHKVSPP
jgi:hypothetical protein